MPAFKHIALALSATAGCNWSQNGNFKWQSRVYAAREESTVSLSLDSNQVICDVQFLIQTTNQQNVIGPFGFDDHLLIAINERVIAASHNELVNVLSQDSYGHVYDWNSIKGTGMSFQHPVGLLIHRATLVFTTYGLPLCCSYKLGIESQFSSKAFSKKSSMITKCDFSCYFWWQWHLWLLSFRFLYGVWCFHWSVISWRQYKNMTSHPNWISFWISSHEKFFLQDFVVSR